MTVTVVLLGIVALFGLLAAVCAYLAWSPRVDRILEEHIANAFTDSRYDWVDGPVVEAPAARAGESPRAAAQDARRKGAAS